MKIKTYCQIVQGFNNYTAYSNKGISSRKLSQLALTDFYRRFRIKNITQNSYAKLSPYIVGTSGNSTENFTVITRESGIPITLVRSLGLKISEVLEKSKELNLTIEEAKEIEKQVWIDSLVKKKSKNKNS